MKEKAAVTYTVGDISILVIIETMPHKTAKAIRYTRVKERTLVTTENEEVVVSNGQWTPTLPFVVRNVEELELEAGRKYWYGKNFRAAVFGASPMLVEKTVGESGKQLYVITNNGTMAKTLTGHKFRCGFVKATVGGHTHMGFRCERMNPRYDTKEIYVLAPYVERAEIDAIEAWRRIRSGLSSPR